MSSRVVGKSSVSGATNNLVSKGKNEFGVSNSTVGQLSHGMAEVSLDAAQDDGKWEEVSSRKSRNRAGSSPAKPWGSHNSSSKAWGQPDVMQKLKNSGGSVRMPIDFNNPTEARNPTRRGNDRSQSLNRGFESKPVASQPVISPPLQHGWNWQARASAFSAKGSEDGLKMDEVINKESNIEEEDGNDDEDDDDALDDDDELLSEDFDSDDSVKSYETRKKNRWYKHFFEILEGLSIDEIGEPERMWHCPACQGGPGAIDWYRGLQPLMTHAKTKRAKRVKLHRELAELLDEELRRRGTSVIPAGEAFGKWKGLEDGKKDHEIVWPPIVIIMNTRLEKDENDKWLGMGNQELLDYFSEYAAVKARHSYGPQGHRGMSVLIFESSARGYFEAERLHQHFAEEGTDRNAWQRCRVLFYPGGKRQLYGYMAVKEDLDIFNQHSQGKSKLKYEMRSYHEMVTQQIWQMSEDNEWLGYWKERVVKEKMNLKALEESFGIVSEKLQKTVEENRIVRQRTQIHHEQNKEELDFQEQFFKDQMKAIHTEMTAKEENFEKLQQEEREKVKQSNASPSNTEEYRHRDKEIAKFIKSQDKEMEDFVAERDKLMKEHEDEMAAMKKRHWEETVKLEKQFDVKLTSLMEKYTPNHSETTANL
uniref:Protein SUPPRESSOR OF GENE SILENCING 3 n=2 Tax=Rhizophora mucronata TaxID=61149 RepID=A0A2P2JI37_RHIMU